MHVATQMNERKSDAIARLDQLSKTNTKLQGDAWNWHRFPSVARQNCMNARIKHGKETCPHIESPHTQTHRDTKTYRHMDTDTDTNTHRYIYIYPGPPNKIFDNFIYLIITRSLTYFTIKNVLIEYNFLKTYHMQEDPCYMLHVCLVSPAVYEWIDSGIYKQKLWEIIPYLCQNFEGGYIYPYWIKTWVSNCTRRKLEI